MQPLAHVRRNFILFLRDFFSSGKIVGPSGDKVYLWDANLDRTQIIIQGANVENPEVFKNSPAILVARSDIQELKEYRALGKNLNSYDWGTGKSQHTSTFSVAVTMSCLSSNQEEAENLAQIVYFILQMHRQFFSKMYNYRVVDLGGIGVPRILQYEGENTGMRVWNAAVVLNLVFHTTYRYKATGDNIDRLYVPFVHVGEGDQADGTHPPVVTWIEGVEND